MFELLNYYYIYGDDNKLSQVLRNVISNALKFTQSGGTVVIFIQAYNNNNNNNNNSTVYPGDINMLKISVTDNGPGISLV